ncbi:MAG TPA: secondary thiamine-phosphate synthase enzyme YjbQ [Candidatus Omnitrophota bacterium]|nr:secondary thiamine-phosphate synthase enzyme YjbQ [Candidatus Omnitrophota bacterium]
MAVFTEYIQLSTEGNADVIDITPRVSEKLRALKLKKGLVNISVIGSTGALTTCEFEPGLVEDIAEVFDKLIPSGAYHHDDAWGDGNGHSHLRSSLVGPSLAIPFDDKELILGTWQQIIFIDFDNRPRDRKIALTFLGE